MRNVSKQLLGCCASLSLLGKRFPLVLCLLVPVVFLSSCSTGTPKYAVRDGIVVSVVDQELAVLNDGKPIKKYKVSTSKFGHGDKKGSNYTPLGRLSVSDKIGGDQPAGMVFKSRKPTGEILEPNAPGRDPIVSRIIWLSGHESQNRNAKPRFIYIHGTPEERKIGRRASYGCIRMKSEDVIELYEMVRQGMPVIIEDCSLRRSLAHIKNIYDPPPVKGRELTSNNRNEVFQSQS